MIDGPSTGAGFAASDGAQYINLTGVQGYGHGVTSDLIPTVIGDSYVLSFDLAGRYGYGNSSVAVSINGGPSQIFSSVYHLTPGVHIDWEHHEMTWTADASSARITLLGANVAGLNNTSTMSLDNVVFESTAIAPPPVVQASVPEPASVALLGLGLLTAALVTRRHQRDA